MAALRPSIIKSYTRVAKNLIAIAEMSGGHRKYNESVRKVAHGDAELTVDPADVGLIVFGFDKAQRDYVWKPLRKSLIKQIEPSQIIDSGKTKGLKIYLPYGQKIKTAAKMTVVQASTMEQLSAPFPTAPHGSA